MTEELQYWDALPVGVKGCGYIPVVKHLCLHPMPDSFGNKTTAVLAILTSEAVVIYHEHERASWEHQMTLKKDDSIIDLATSLAWDPNNTSLFVGDEKGKVISCIYSKLEELTDEDCTYEYASFYKHEQQEEEHAQKVCSMVWNEIGDHLAIAFPESVLIFRRQGEKGEQFIKKTIHLQSGPNNYVVQLHPAKPYLFLGAENYEQFKVFANIVPDKEDQMDWTEVCSTNSPGGIIEICVQKGVLSSALMVFTAGKVPTSWRFFRHKRKDGTRILKLQPSNRLIEDSKSIGKLVSSVLGVKRFVSGFSNGSISIFTWNRKRLKKNKYAYQFESKGKYWPLPQFANPSLACLRMDPTDDRILVEGGNFGFIHFWKIVTTMSSRVEKDGEGEQTKEGEPTAVPSKSSPSPRQDADFEINYYSAGPLASKDAFPSSSHGISNPAHEYCPTIQSVLQQHAVHGQKLKALLFELKSIGESGVQDMDLQIHQDQDQGSSNFLDRLHKQQGEHEQLLTTLCEEVQRIKRLPRFG